MTTWAEDEAHPLPCSACYGSGSAEIQEQVAEDVDRLRAEVLRLRTGIEAIRDEAWEPWLNRDWQHLDTIRNDCNALLYPAEGEGHD